MRKLRIFAWMGAALMLAACGGETLTGGSTTPTPTPTSTVASISVSTSSASIAADGSTTATISAIAKDADNAVVSGVTVAFTASAGSITVTQATTDATGLATATVKAGTAAPGTAITVTATSGKGTGTVTVNVANTQQTISVITNLGTIPSDGSKSATITALVRNAQNQFVSGVPVTFSATSGGLTITQPTTGLNGAATATLTSAGDPSNRKITVTAAAGTATSTVNVYVTGTNLTVTGPSTLVQGAQGTYTVALVDAGGNGIGNQAVTVSSKAGNTLSATSLTTSATTGQATFTLTGTVGGADTITATGLGLTSTTVLSVSPQNFNFTVPTAANTQVNLGTNQTLTVVWTNGGAPVVNQPVAFSATRGTLSASTVNTDSTGTASVTISSTTAGPALISATASQVSASASLDFIAKVPAAIALQASPSTVETTGTSTLTATVRDANNNLVEGQTVNFLITQDSTGGSLSVASAITNVQGQATTVYTATGTTSASNGVIISATVAGTAVNATTTLTVGGETVFLSLGTGNTITALNSTQYEYPYSVQAIDSAGSGVNNVTVSYTVTSLGYFKGYFIYPVGASAWEQILATAQAAPLDPDDYSLLGYHGCLSEDLLDNGIYVASEDYNNNGKLDPGLVVSTDVGSSVTANGGTATVNLIYPKDHAKWVAVKLTATAIVSGNQASASASFILPGLATDYTSATVTPPGVDSPYGIANTCLNPK